MAISIVNPISGSHILIDDLYDKPYMCEECGEKRKFFDWKWCWTCGINKIIDIEIKRYWQVLAYYKGAERYFQDLSFDEAKFNFEGQKQKLMGRTFINCSFVGASFMNIDFSNCIFQGVDFRGARFTNCILHSSKFENCEIKFVRFHNIDLKRSIMSHIAVKSSIFESSTVLRKCSFENGTFDDTRVAGKTVDMTDANLRGVRFTDCDLRNCDFRSAFVDRLMILGKNSETRGLRLTFAQMSNIRIDPEIDIYTLNLKLLSKRSSRRSKNLPIKEYLLIRDICNGITSQIGMILNGISVGILCGFLYWILTGAFRSESPFRFLIKASVIFSGLFVAVGVCISTVLIRLRRRQLIKYRVD